MEEVLITVLTVKNNKTIFQKEVLFFIAKIPPPKIRKEDMCISDMSEWLRDIVPLILFGCKYNHNSLKYNDYAKKKRNAWWGRRAFKIARTPVHFPEKVLNDPNDLKVFKDFKDSALPPPNNLMTATPFCAYARNGTVCALKKRIKLENFYCL